MISADTKSKAISSTQRHKTDTGSPEAQVSVLTTRIAELTDHLKTHKQDNHNRRGLLQMVGKRKRLLAYLKRTDFEAYQGLIKKLNIRG